MKKIIKKCLPTYEVVRKLGEGVYGTVYHVRDNLKERAVKVVPIRVERSLSYISPRDLNSKISHDFYVIQEYYGKIKGEGVVEIYDFHLVDKQITQNEAKAHLVILMELCPENLLDHVLDNYPIPPEDARKLMLDLAYILNRLSSHVTDAFIVKDLKPSNILITQADKLVIGDLGGLQRISSASATAKAQFTPNWSAPELITHSSPATVASLIFSYGFVCYFIWSGTLPYDKSDFSERIRQIKKHGIKFRRKGLPDDLREMISRCLQFSPKDRLKDFNEIIAMIKGEAINRKPPLREIPWDKPGFQNSLQEKPAKTIKKKRVSKKASRVSAHKKTNQSNRTGGSSSNGTEGTDRHMVGDTWIGPVTGMEFVWVPSGTFSMGCGKWAGKGKKNEFPVHEVTISGFWLGRFPVTQGQWKRVMSGWLTTSNPSWFKMGDNHPVEQVSWNEAKEFLEKLISLNKGRYHFRLPTEAEWEYAARSGGKNELYPGGKPIDKVAWYSQNSGMTTHEVGRLAADGLGLYDMAGQVYEWCEDVFNEDAYRHHEKKDPVFCRGNGSRRVIRGGSWSNFPSELRTAYRGSLGPDFKVNYVGFRVVMTPISLKRGL